MVDGVLLFSVTMDKFILTWISPPSMSLCRLAVTYLMVDMDMSNDGGLS